MTHLHQDCRYGLNRSKQEDQETKSASRSNYWAYFPSNNRTNPRGECPTTKLTQFEDGFTKYFKKSNKLMVRAVNAADEIINNGSSFECRLSLTDSRDAQKYFGGMQIETKP